MPKHNLQVGDRVWWGDPDEGKCSQAGTIVHVQHAEADAVIAIDTDAGGNLEALPGELTKLREVGMRLSRYTRQEYDALVEVPENFDDDDVATALSGVIVTGLYLDDESFLDAVAESHDAEDFRGGNHHIMLPDRSMIKREGKPDGRT